MKGMFSSQPCNANQYILSKNDNFRFASCTWMKKAPRTHKVISSLCTGQRAASYTLSFAKVLHGRPRAQGRAWVRQFWFTGVSNSRSFFCVQCLIPEKNGNSLFVINWESSKYPEVLLHLVTLSKGWCHLRLVHTQKHSSCLAPGMRISLLQKIYLTL